MSWLVEEKKMLIIKKGTMFTVSEGEYSDYGVESVCEALEDLNLSMLEEEYKTIPRDDTGFHLDITYWLTQVKRVAKEFDFVDFHTGSYGDSKFELWRE